MAVDPFTGMLIGSAVSGGVQGATGLFGRRGSTDTTPDIIDPTNLWNFFWSLMNSEEQRRATEEAARKTDQQIADSLRIAQETTPEAMRLYDEGATQGIDELKRLYERTMAAGERLPQSAENQRRTFFADYDRRAQNAQAGYQGDIQGFLNQLGASNQEIIGGYQDRYKKAEADLAGYGEQQKADVDRRFEERYGMIANDLVSRGLASSTESAKQQLLNTELQSSEQRRLGEDLTRNRINVLGGMSGEQLAAQERLSGRSAEYQFGGIQSAAGRNAQLESARAAFDAAARGDVEAMKRFLIGIDQQGAGNLANAYFTNAGNRSNIFTQGTDRILGVLGDINYIPPPPNNLSFLLGQNSANVPQSASPWPSFAAAAGPGIGQGFGALAYNAFMPRAPAQFSTPYPYNLPQYPGGWGPPSW